MLKHLLPISDEVLAVNDGSFNAVLMKFLVAIFVHQIAQGLLAFQSGGVCGGLRHAREGRRRIDQPVVSARNKVSLEF